MATTMGFHHSNRRSGLTRAAHLVRVAALCLLVISLLVWRDGIAAQPAVSQPVVSDAMLLAQYPIEKRIRYGFEVRNGSNQRIAKANLISYAPVRRLASQWLVDLRASHPYQIDVDPIGNQVLRFEIENLPPYGTQVITITADLRLAATPNHVTTAYIEDYLLAEPYVELEDPMVQDLAARLSRVEGKSQPRLVYDWVSRHIEHAGYLRRDKGAVYALTTRKGDCTEFMYLSTALLRANAVPARGIAGFRVGSNSVLRAADYHNWTEYLDDGVWRILDAQEGAFDDGYGTYIAFRTFGRHGGGALSQSQRFIAYDQRLEVRMH